MTTNRLSWNHLRRRAKRPLYLMILLVTIVGCGVLLLEGDIHFQKTRDEGGPILLDGGTQEWHQVGNDSVLDRTSLALENDLQIQRWRLTKSVYPLTLTTPFLIQNPEICAGKVTLLIIVHTALFHFDRRIQLRLSFGNTKLFKDKYNIRIAFLLGKSNEKKIQLLVNQENEKHGDIVQGDFEDTYRNLTLKGVMAFRWISLHCSHAEMVMKIDDDIFVNIFKILGHYFPMYKRRKRLLACNTVFPGPILRGRSRWTIGSDDFRGMKHYPRYCSGFAVLMTTDTVRAFYHAAHFTPVFWVDDVYLYGLLPAMANITHRVMNRNVTLHNDICEKSYKTDNPELVVCSASRTYEFEFFWKRSVMTLPSQTIRHYVNDSVVAQVIYSANIDIKKKKGKYGRYILKDYNADRLQTHETHKL